MSDLNASEKAKEQGTKAFQEKDYEGAIKHYTEAIDLGGGSHILYSNRSAAYASLGQWQSAREDAQNCTDLRPEWPKGWSRLGAAEFGLKKYDAAIDAYSRVQKLDPDNVQVKKDLEQARKAKGSSSYSRGYTPSPGTTAAPSGGRLLSIALICSQLFVIAQIFMSLMPGPPVNAFIAFKSAMLASMVSSIAIIFSKFGVPNFGTLKKVWGILRKQQPGDQSMFNVLTDPQLHYMLYASLFLTAAPSFAYGVPLLVMSVMDICRRLTASFPSLPGVVATSIGKLIAKTPEINRQLANLEVLLLFVMVFHLFTANRNILLIFLYANCFLRFRYMSNNDSKIAWSLVKIKTDSVFLAPAMPAALQTVYTKIVSFVTGLGNPVPPQ